MALDMTSLVTRTRLARDLARLELTAGDVVMVHAESV
jgi:aminoglycoside N3'-acetyltransferase